MIETQTYNQLKTHTGLTALVGDRIYPLILPQDPIYPAITYFKVSHPEAYSKSGPSGLSYPRMQISCWAKSYLTAKQVAEQVKLAMHDFAEYVTKESEQDIYEPDTGVYHIPLDFVIHHKE